MSEPSSAEKEPAAPFKPHAPTIQIGRAQIAVNVFVQAVAMLVLVFLANYLSFRHHRSIDWSTTQKYTLSPQTLAVIKQLQEPCKVIVYFFVQDQVQQDTVSLLREYEAQSNHKLAVEVVDPRVSLTRAKELQAKYRFGAENIVIIDYKGKSKWVEARDFAEVENLPPEKQDPQKGQMVRMKSFKGEQFITAAMMDLEEEKQNKVYIVTGHGELDLPSPDFTKAQEYLKRQNFKIESLLLAGMDKVPEDAGALIIAAPLQDFSERDIKLLDLYWGQNGRIFIAVGPEAKADRLIKWIADRGVILHRDTVLFVTRKLVEGVVDKFEIRPAEGAFVPGSRICNGLSAAGFLGNTQSMEPVAPMVQTGQVTVAKLIETPMVRDKYVWWGETSPLTENDVPFYDPAKDYPHDKPGPLTLAVAVEKGAARDPQVKLNTPRLVVVGNGDFLSNPGLQVWSEGQVLLANGMNWALSREALIELPAKEKPMNDVDLTPRQLANLGWALILALPLFFGLIGLYYIWWRHGRNLLVLTIVVCSTGLILWGAVEGVSRWATSAPAEEKDGGDLSIQP